MFSWSWPKDPPADLPPNFVFVGLNSLEDSSSGGIVGSDGGVNEEIVVMGNPMPDLAG